MAVVRQTQRVFNKPIGVTRMNTGEAELWQTVSNAASTINNIAMDYEKTVGVSQAQEAALGVARDDVISIDHLQVSQLLLKLLNSMALYAPVHLQILLTEDLKNLSQMK